MRNATMRPTFKHVRQWGNPSPKAVPWSNPSMDVPSLLEGSQAQLHERCKLDFASISPKSDGTEPSQSGTRAWYIAEVWHSKKLD